MVSVENTPLMKTGQRKEKPTETKFFISYVFCTLNLNTFEGGDFISGGENVFDTSMDADSRLLASQVTKQL